MSSVLRDTPFSVLDRSRIREGEDAPRALRDTVAFAREAEAPGYHRFWVSEHHGVPGVAGSAPTVLAAAIAAATSRIRVGTGGVMLPNHRPLVVAELFPGRTDMGLGRSVSFTDGIRKALGHGKEDAGAFDGQVTELLGWFTGATADPAYSPLRQVVDQEVERWLALHPCPSYGLVVAHTHGHGDHIAGDGQFADRPRTVTVGSGREAVTAFFGLPDWPEGSASLDLGGRVLDILPGPGHEPAAAVFHDRRTGLLFTGDTLYPGHLYVGDLTAYTATIDRLLAFCERHPVTHLLGCHIEMTTMPGVDYPRGTTHQPDEPPLQLDVGHLRALRRALTAAGGRPGVHRHDAFVLHIGSDGTGDGSGDKTGDETGPAATGGGAM